MNHQCPSQQQHVPIYRVAHKRPMKYFLRPAQAMGKKTKERISRLAFVLRVVRRLIDQIVYYVTFRGDVPQVRSLFYSLLQIPLLILHARWMIKVMLLDRGDRHMLYAKSWANYDHPTHEGYG